MTISRTWSDESVIDGENGEYWRRPPSIISKKISLKDVIIFSQRIKYISSMWSTLPTPLYPGNWGLQMDEVERHLSKHRILIKKVKGLIFEVWRKKSKHISVGDKIKQKEYVVKGQMRRWKKSSKKSRKYAYGGDENCYITSVVTAEQRRKSERDNPLDLT